MLFLIILLSYTDNSEQADLIAKRHYLSAAEQLINKAHQLIDPIVLRDYVILITEYHSGELGFRTFFLKDLRQGERLADLRAKEEKITLNTKGRMLEHNLEQFLQRAHTKYPNQPDVAFAIATYLYRGRCCIKSKLKMTPLQVLEQFRAANKRGVVSPGSLLALSEDAQNRKAYNEALAYLEHGLTIKPADTDLVQAYMNELLRRAKNGQAISQARKLFELSQLPELRAEALTGAARGLFGEGKHAEAAKTAQSALRILPAHSLAQCIVFDSYRAMGSSGDYQEVVTDFLALDLDNPAWFQFYMDYLRLRGVTQDDRQLMAGYGQLNDDDPLTRITLLVNLGSFARLEQQKKQALAYFEKARELAGKLEHPPKDLLPILNRLLKVGKKPKE